MLVARADLLGQSEDFLAAVGEEGDILIGLDALAFQQVHQAAFRPAVKTVDDAKVPRRSVLRHRPADDDLEIALPLVPVADIAAVETDHDAPVENRKVRPVPRRTVEAFAPATIGRTSAIRLAAAA